MKKLKLWENKQLYGAINKKTGSLIGFTVQTSKSKAKEKLEEHLTWSNCFDQYFKPSEAEMNAFKIVKVSFVKG